MISNHNWAPSARADTGVTAWAGVMNDVETARRGRVSTYKKRQNHQGVLPYEETTKIMTVMHK